MNMYPGTDPDIYVQRHASEVSPGPCTGADPAPIYFSKKMVKYILVVCAVMLFWNLIIALHGSIYRYSICQPFWQLLQFNTV